jgi:hypothetical protein
VSGTVETIETVRVSFQRFLVLGQSVPQMFYFQEHVSEHFARGQLNFSLAFRILFVRDGAQEAKGFVIFSFGESLPGMSLTAVCAHVISFIGTARFANGVEHGVVLLHGIAGGGYIAQMTRGDGPCSIGDRLATGFSTGGGLESQCFLPLMRFEFIHRGEMRAHSVQISIEARQDDASARTQREVSSFSRSVMLSIFERNRYPPHYRAAFASSLISYPHRR